MRGSDPLRQLPESCAVLLSRWRSLSGQGWEVLGRGVAERSAEGFLLQASPSTALRVATTRRLPHPILCLHLRLFPGCEGSVEVVVGDDLGASRRLLLSTFVRDVPWLPLAEDEVVAKLPLPLHQDVWHCLSLPLSELVPRLWPERSFVALQGVTVTANFVLSSVVGAISFPLQMLADGDRSYALHSYSLGSSSNGLSRRRMVSAKGARRLPSQPPNAQLPDGRSDDAHHRQRTSSLPRLSSASSSGSGGAPRVGSAGVEKSFPSIAEAPPRPFLQAGRGKQAWQGLAGSGGQGSRSRASSGRSRVGRAPTWSKQTQASAAQARPALPRSHTQPEGATDHRRTSFLQRSEELSLEMAKIRASTPAHKSPPRSAFFAQKEEVADMVVESLYSSGGETSTLKSESQSPSEQSCEAVATILAMRVAETLRGPDERCEPTDDYSDDDEWDLSAADELGESDKPEVPDFTFPSQPRRRVPEHGPAFQPGESAASVSSSYSASVASLSRSRAAERSTVVAPPKPPSSDKPPAPSGLSLDEDELAVLASMRRSALRSTKQGIGNGAGDGKGGASVRSLGLAKHVYEDDMEEGEDELDSVSRKLRAYRSRGSSAHSEMRSAAPLSVIRHSRTTSSPRSGLRLSKAWVLRSGGSLGDSLEQALSFSPREPSERLGQSGTSSVRRDGASSTRGGTDSGLEDVSNEALDLVFDPLLNCYFDPHTGKYYKVASL